MDKLYDQGHAQSLDQVLDTFAQRAGRVLQAHATGWRQTNRGNQKRHAAVIVLDDAPNELKMKDGEVGKRLTTFSFLAGS